MGILFLYVIKFDYKIFQQKLKSIDFPIDPVIILSKALKIDLSGISTAIFENIRYKQIKYLINLRQVLSQNILIYIKNTLLYYFTQLNCLVSLSKNNNQLQNRTQRQKHPMTQFETKTIKIYKSKSYEMNISSFINFVNEKVEVDSYCIDLIREKIQQFGIDESFNQETFRFLLRLITGVQKNKESIKNMSQQEVNQIKSSITYKSSKKAKNNQSSQEKSSSSISQSSSPTMKQEQKQNQNNSKSSAQKLNVKPSSNIKLEQIVQEQIEESKLGFSQKKEEKQTKLTSKTQKKEIQQQKKNNYTYQDQNYKKTETNNKTNQKVYQKSKQAQKQKQIQNSRKEAQKHETKQLTSNSKSFNQNKKPQHLKTIEQVQNSSEINQKQTQLKNNKKQNPVFLDMTDSKQQKTKVKIIQYQKFSTDYINSVIKYTIQYGKYRVLRRFSEFQKLINLLREKYQGIILPELPPKQGIKGGISYFWGIDEAFLEQRKKKLQELLNRLLQSNFIAQDLTLKNFLTDQNYEIQTVKQDYVNYIKGLTDIAFNVKQLKDYSVAYINYIKQKGTVKLNPQIQKKYEQLLKIIKICIDINEYRKKINVNFDRRREILFEMSIATNKPYCSDFDKKMDLIQQEIKNLNYQIEKYKKLKFEESWIHNLIKQKQIDNTQVPRELKQDEVKIQNRIKKMEQNLSISLDEFKQNKIKQLQQINQEIIKWRQNVHP